MPTSHLGLVSSQLRFVILLDISNLIMFTRMSNQRGWTLWKMRLTGKCHFLLYKDCMSFVVVVVVVVVVVAVVVCYLFCFHISADQTVCLSVCLIYIPVLLNLLSTYLSGYPSIYMYLFVCLPVYLSLFPQSPISFVKNCPCTTL